MVRPGARNLITDVPGIRVGQAEDQLARTGVTVVLPDEPARAAVDMRGGAPGTRETDALDPMSLTGRIDAVVLSGGSAFGLDSASGRDGVAERTGTRFRVARRSSARADRAGRDSVRSRERRTVFARDLPRPGAKGGGVGRRPSFRSATRARAMARWPAPTRAGPEAPRR